jgi:hypothetical protein
MAKTKLMASDIELAVATSKFPYRQFLVGTRLSWGMGPGFHECDVLAMTSRGYLHEVEIKVSISDLRRDHGKRHHHADYAGRIKYLWFAVPSLILDQALPEIPADAGILAVDEDLWLRTQRPATPRRGARPLRADEIAKFQRLLGLRYWLNRENTRRDRARIKELVGLLKNKEGVKDEDKV